MQSFRRGSNSVTSQDAIGGSLKRKGTTEQKLQIEPIRRNLYLSNLVGTKRSEDRYSWTSPRRLATVIASVRLSTFNFVKMLRKCPFTVVSLMKRFAPISLLLLPRASKVNTPSSRPVRVS